jgi:hypothetical protein
MSDATFNLMIGLAATALVLAVPAYYALKHFLGIDMRVEFYAAQAEFVGAWFDMKERREAAADRRRTPIRYTPKRKN